jgi:hypothetical protein
VFVCVVFVQGMTGCNTCYKLRGLPSTLSLARYYREREREGGRERERERKRKNEETTCATS